MIKNRLKIFINRLSYYLVPQILKKDSFVKILNKIFHKDKILHHYEFDNNFYKRHAFINKAISKFDNCRYLEIGVGNNDVFNSIPLKESHKFGVDPVTGGNFKMSSNEFFEKYNNLKFDVIFIDGLHEYKQCQKDCINSMSQLNEKGIIFFHDFFPRSYFEEKVPRVQSSWTGDVWKVAVELSNSKNVDFKIINIDHGIGILKLKKNFEYIKNDKLNDEGFSEFLNYKKNLPIISCNDALDFIMQ